MIDWKATAKRYRRQLRAELSGSRKLYVKLVEETKRRIQGEKHPPLLACFASDDGRFQAHKDGVQS